MCQIWVLPRTVVQCSSLQILDSALIRVAMRMVDFNAESVPRSDVALQGKLLLRRMAGSRAHDTLIKD